jgi:hypothetical protein
MCVRVCVCGLHNQEEFRRKCQVSKNDVSKKHIKTVGTISVGRVKIVGTILVGNVKTVGTILV